MKRRRIATHFAVLCPLALGTFTLPASQSTTIQPGQRIYVVAVRDSRLFTMNIPDSDKIKTKTRSVRWAYDIFFPGNSQPYILPTINCQWHVAFPGRPPILLPVPADSLQDCQEKNPLRSTLEGTVPDRIRLDTEIKRRVEKEFRKQKLYSLADSPDQADYVFLVEARYFPNDMVITPPEIPEGLPKYHRSEHLESALAIVVPSAVYRQHPLDNAPLLAARLWDGETLVEYGPKYRGLSPGCPAQVGPCSLGVGGGIIPGDLIDPSPEDLVKKFHDNFRGPRFHLPLCLPANPPSSRTAYARSDKSKPVLNANEAGMPIEGLSEAKVADDKTIKVDVTLVTVPAMVTGSNGGYVRDLKVSDFRLFENGVQQKIDRLIPAAEPVNMVLVLGNMRLNSAISFEDVQRSALEFVEAMRADDRMMVVSFDDKIHIESEFTNDRVRLRRAILQIEFGCGSRLYDAVDLVLTERLSRTSGRKAMVLFTDGRDWGSRLVSAGETLAKMEEAGVPVYAVQYTIAFTNNRAEYWPSEYLLKLSSGSGGRHTLTKSILDVAGSFAQIADDLQNQYTLCYYPSDKPRNGDYRRVSILVDRPGLKVRAPTGYRAKF